VQIRKQLKAERDAAHVKDGISVFQELYAADDSCFNPPRFDIKLDDSFSETESRLIPALVFKRFGRHFGSSLRFQAQHADIIRFAENLEVLLTYQRTLAKCGEMRFMVHHWERLEQLPAAHDSTPPDSPSTSPPPEEKG
jgi:hypothetical protein